MAYRRVGRKKREENEGKRATQYVIGAVETLTKYMVAQLCKVKPANSVSDFILNRIIFKFGVPAVITSDNGKEFHPHVQSFFLQNTLGTRRIKTCPYNPRVNREIEHR